MGGKILKLALKEYNMVSSIDGRMILVWVKKHDLRV